MKQSKKKTNEDNLGVKCGRWANWAWLWTYLSCSNLCTGLIDGGDNITPGCDK